MYAGDGASPVFLSYGSALDILYEKYYKVYEIEYDSPHFPDVVDKYLFKSYIEKKDELHNGVAEIIREKITNNSSLKKDVDDAVYSTLIMKNGLCGQLAVNWSDDTHRKATTSLKIEGDGGKLEADTTTLKIFVKHDMPEHNLVKGWNAKYITELTQPVFFNLRGEEFSLENDNFIQCIKDPSVKNRNSFESALKTDFIIHKLMDDANQQ